MRARPTRDRWCTASTSATDSSSSPSATRRTGATFERLDARALPFEQEFDAAICLCQGAFGLMVDDGDDDAVVAGIARALVPGGVLALSAFNAYFAVKYHVDATFDAATGIAHERTEIRNEAGEAIETDLWTCCYTPRELRSILGRHGLAVDRISSVEPGAYGSAPPTVESPEFLVHRRTRASLSVRPSRTTTCRDTRSDAGLRAVGLRAVVARSR